MLSFFSKVTESNKFSSTVLAAFVLCVGCYLSTHSEGNNYLLYTGLAIIILMSFLTVDAYYKSSIKEHYELIIKHYDKMLNDSRRENTQNKALISEQIKTAQYIKPTEPYKNLMDDGN